MCAEFVILPLVNPNFERQTIDIDQIRKISSTGLDECPVEDRALAWLAMLGVYPNDPLKWAETRNEIKETYFMYAEENKLSQWHTRNIPNQITHEAFGFDTDKKNAMMGIIHGDIVRTGRTIFCLPPREIPVKTDDELEVQASNDNMYMWGEHARRMERILFLFSTLNSGLGYMQGFNELVVPFYYVLLKAGTGLFNDNIDLIEALTWQCFQTLLTESTLNEFYTTADASSIIMHKLSEFEALVAKHLPEVAQTIKRLGIHPLLYSFRWFNLLFSQEHHLPTLIAIWDDLLAHFSLTDPQQLMKFVFYVGLGHLNNIKGRLDRTSYGETIKVLQNMEDLDYKLILTFANDCWNRDMNPDKREGGFFGFIKQAITGSG